MRVAAVLLLTAVNAEDSTPAPTRSPTREGYTRPPGPYAPCNLQAEIYDAGLVSTPERYRRCSKDSDCILECPDCDPPWKSECVDDGIWKNNHDENYEWDGQGECWYPDPCAANRFPKPLKAGTEGREAHPVSLGTLANPSQCDPGSVFYWNQETINGDVVNKCKCESGCTGYALASCCGQEPTGQCVASAAYYWSAEDNGFDGLVHRCRCKFGCTGFTINDCCDDKPVPVLPCGEVMFSAYVEGTGWNKAIAIYNPGPGIAYMTNYRLQVCKDGCSGGTTPQEHTFVATMIAPGAEYVICNPKFGDLSKCDETNWFISHNGNDAYQLKKDGVVIDNIGELGVNPGQQWSVCSGDTFDSTMYRKIDVCQGSDWTSSSTTATCQWEMMPVNDFSQLGAHTTPSCCAPTEEPTSAAPATVAPTGTPCLLCETWDQYESVTDAVSAGTWRFKKEAHGFGNSYQSSASTASIVDDPTGAGKGKVLTYTGEVHYGDTFSNMSLKTACQNGCTMEVTMQGSNFYGGLADRIPNWPTDHTHVWSFQAGAHNSWTTETYSFNDHPTWENIHLMFEMFGPGPLYIDTIKVYPSGTACECLPPETQAPTIKATSSPTYDLTVQFGVEENVDHHETEHSFRYAHMFPTTPIIIAGVPTEHGDKWITLRLRNVTGDGFKMFGQPASCDITNQTTWQGNGHGGSNGQPAMERVPWMAVAPGRRTLPDGTIYEAGTLTLENHNIQEVVFSAPIKDAVILATVQTFNGPQPVFLRVTERTDTHFKIRMQEDEGTDDGHYPETIGWVAITSGKGTIGSRGYVARNTELHIDHSYQTVLHNVETPNCVFATVGFAGHEGGVLRTDAVLGTNGGNSMDIRLRVHEDQCKDLEMQHTQEQVSVFAVPGCHKAHNSGVSGDPFVVDQNGERVQFFLPLRESVLLLKCQKMELYGTAFGTGMKHDHQQWFDHFRVVIDGRDELKVAVKKNATEIIDDESGKKPNPMADLAVLTVTVEGNPMTKAGAVGTESASLVAVWQRPSGETVQFSTASGGMVVQIRSAVAQKFSTGHQQVLYTHLDLRFIELTPSRCSDGILAQIWGVVPMTQATSVMLQPPK